MYLSHRRALFLDRDGVINVDHGYVSRTVNFEFIDGIFELCRRAKTLEYLILVVTNQAGIGRGHYSERDFLELTRWMCGVFRDRGASIDKVYFCPYHPEHGIGNYRIDSPLRKPAPGMILQAANEFDIDLNQSVLVGDNDSDIQAGIAAGVGRNLLYRPSDRVSDRDHHHHTVATIRKLVDAIP
jgi:D-glycero-D-manno-heptose 1,7-bisphosphate phosphatase